MMRGMLAFDDAALARIVIGATRVDPRHRGKWLRELAEKLDPASAPPPAKLAARRERSRRSRKRQRNGMRSYRLDLPDAVVGGVINALVATQKLSEADAADQRKVEAVLSSMFTDWAAHWIA